MKCVNGYKNPKFHVVDAYNVRTTYRFSDYIQGINEYEEDIFVVTELLSGEDVQDFSHIKLYWELDLSQYMQEDDRKIIQAIREAERIGNTIICQPHEEVEREFEVFTVKDRRKLSPEIGGTINKDYIIWFYTNKPVLNPNWQTADDLHLIGIPESRTEGILTT